MVAVAVWWTTLASAAHPLATFLDPLESERLAAYVHPADQARFLLGAVLVRMAVGHARDVDPRQVSVDRTCAECGRSHGRPVVAGGPWLSVSHSGVLVAVALCERAPVGLDVQRDADVAGSARAWVRREARLKVAAEPGEPVELRDLRSPLPGYSAALAVAGYSAALTGPGASTGP